MAMKLLVKLSLAGLLCAVFVAGYLIYLNYLDAAKHDVGLDQVRTIETAVRAYHARHGAFPQTLDDLLQPPNGMPAMVQNAVCVDPWGQAIHYDAAGHHHQGQFPDIWSDGPPGENRPKTNW